MINARSPATSKNMVHSVDIPEELNSLSHFDLFYDDEQCVYFFTTDCEYEYVASFAEYPIVSDDAECTAVMFNLDRCTEHDRRRKEDNDNLRNTVIIIIYKYMIAFPNVIVTICESKDGYGKARNVLFGRWFRNGIKETGIDWVEKCDEACMMSDGSYTYASLLYRKDVQNVEIIKRSFSEAASNKFYNE